MTSSKRPPAGWVYLVVFVAMGLSLSLLGPALTYLRERAQVSKGDIGALFVAQAVGYLLGSLFSGRLFDRGVGHRAVAGGLLGIAASAVMIPFCTTVLALSAPFALVGAFAGCIDVGCNTLVVWHTRGTGSVRLLNALHLFFGIGALISPGLVDRSLVWSHGLSLVTTVVASVSIVLAAVVMMHEPPTPGAPATPQSSGGPVAVQTPRRILFVIGVFFFLYVGVEVGFSGWLKTYAEAIDLPGVASPTWLNTAFWLSFTLGRLLAVVLSRRLRAGFLLAGSCAATAVLLGVLALADGAPGAVWVVTVLVGFTVAPQFATMIAYAEQHIELSGRSTSWFVSAAGVGGLALPFAIGRLLDRSGSGAMPIAVFVAATAATGWLVLVRREITARAASAALDMAATG